MNLSKGETKPYLAIFLGAPGAGKGTQSTLVSEHFRLQRIETSKLLEARFKSAKEDDEIEVSGKRYVIAEQEHRWRTGLLCEDGFVAFIVGEKLQELYAGGKSVVLDGFPRTIGQLEPLLPFILDSFGKDHIAVIYIDIQEEEAVFRNSNRRICDLMRHPILFTPETENLTMCPLDGSKLVKRALDDPKVIKVRFEEFRTQTLPLLNYFADQEIPLHTVKAEQSVVNVFSHVSEILGKLS
ncbi:MAG: nucleoside monophosphate kinase [Candidatus Wildermuthbacteria bacterium]|nr:nucleoside monophosphate kinase [Candidatus Wildermuthbacteria bacterium]